MSEYTFTDRYQATGHPYPDVETMCKGHCDGMGCVPCKADDADSRLVALWHDAENKPRNRINRVIRAVRGLPRDDYHIVMCPDCNGTGKRAVPRTEEPSRG